MTETPRFGLLLFPDLMQLDLAGPAEVFGAELHLVWKSRAPVANSAGWSMVPTTTFTDCPQLDVICVPGGRGQIALMDDDETLDFVRGQSSGARLTTSVCTGSLVLAAAGLLRGYRAACHWMSRDQLALPGVILVAKRVARDRDRITGGGVTAGIDFGLTVVAELYGNETVKLVLLEIEYDPAPPFAAGSPDRAAPELVAHAERQAWLRQEQRRAATERAARRLEGLSSVPGILRSPIMRRLMPTAKTTVLPANDGPTNQKGLALCAAIRRQPWWKATGPLSGVDAEKRTSTPRPLTSDPQRHRPAH